MNKSVENSHFSTLRIITLLVVATTSGLGFILGGCAAAELTFNVTAFFTTYECIGGIALGIVIGTGAAVAVIYMLLPQKKTSDFSNAPFVAPIPIPIPQIQPPKPDNVPLLHKAVHVQTIELLEKALSYTDDINELDASKNTALHYAIIKNGAKTEEKLIPVVQKLLDHNIALNKTNNIGYTALHYAALEGYLETVRLLLDKGADPDCINDNFNKPIDYAQTNEMRDLLRSKMMPD